MMLRLNKLKGNDSSPSLSDKGTKSMKSLRILSLAVVLALSASSAFAGDIHIGGAPVNTSMGLNGEIQLGGNLLAEILTIIF